MAWQMCRNNMDSGRAVVENRKGKDAKSRYPAVGTHLSKSLFHMDDCDNDRRNSKVTGEFWVQKELLSWRAMERWTSFD